MNKEEIISMTVKEALEAGYTKCGYDLAEWQSVMNVSDFTNPAEFEHHGKIVLFSKNTYHPKCDADIIKESIAEMVAINHSDETGDDTDDVFDSIMELDFTSVVKMINDKLSTQDYFMGTKIQLVP